MTQASPPPQTRLERLGDWIDALPELWRPVVYGAGLILLFMGMRGGLYIVPIAIVYVFVTSSTPFADIAKGAIVVLLYHWLHKRGKPSSPALNGRHHNLDHNGDFLRLGNGT